MSKFNQLSLKPGRYYVGNGRYRNLTKSDLSRYRENTNAMLAAGVSVPVLLEHAQPGSDDGAPKYAAGKTREQLAAEVKHGTGWLDSVAIEADGSMAFALDVTDADASKKIEDGSIKYTSPEFRHTYQDGAGRIWNDVIGHVALTHQPRSTDQGGFTPEVEVAEALAGATQFSLADLLPEGEQFSTADPFAKKKNKSEGGNQEPTLAAAGDAGVEGDNPAANENANPDASENPDMPKAGLGNQQLEAILAHLTELGIPLPSDTSEKNFYDRLLTGLLVAEAQRSKAEAEAAKDEDENDDDNGQNAAVEESKPPMQFSLAEANAGLQDAALTKLIRRHADDLRLKCDAMVVGNKISPKLRSFLLSDPDTMQFSAAGDELPRYTVEQILDAIEDGMPGGQFFADQFATSEVQKADDKWMNDKGKPGQGGTNEELMPAPEDVQKLVEAQLAGTMFRGM